MKKMKKDNLLNYLILVFLYIGISALPFNLFVKNSDLLVLLFQCIAQLFYVIFAYFFIKRHTTFKLKSDRKSNKIIIFLPCLLACGSNFLYFAFVNSSISFKYSVLLIPQIVLNLFIVYNEEILFRLLFLNNTGIKSNLGKIVASAGIFALCHLSYFISSFNPGDLLNVVYTFFLGLMLAMVYLYTNKITMTVVLHFLFNVINGVLFSSFNAAQNLYLYILANAIIVVILGIYLLIVYLKLEKKEAK